MAISTEKLHLDDQPFTEGPVSPNLSAKKVRRKNVRCKWLASPADQDNLFLKKIKSQTPEIAGKARKREYSLFFKKVYEIANHLQK